MDFLAPAYNWLKVIHVVAVIAWMAGLLYLPRLFIYHHGAEPGGEAADLFVVMERRLMMVIMNPALIATWLFGLLMVAAAPSWGNDGWFIVKFLAVVGLSGLHGFFSASRKRFAAGETPYTPKFWRLMNEAPTVLMILIVAMVILKPFIIS